MSAMHESVERLMNLAAKKLGRQRVSKKELAALLGISAQTLTNWCSRGVSREGAMLAEQHLGTSSTFVRDGLRSYPMPEPATEQVEDPISGHLYNAWPFRNVTPAQIRKLTLEELDYIEAVIHQKLATRLAINTASSAKSET